jgi:hypothetical protein
MAIELETELPRIWTNEQDVEEMYRLLLLTGKTLPMSVAIEAATIAATTLGVGFLDRHLAVARSHVGSMGAARLNTALNDVTERLASEDDSVIASQPTRDTWWAVSAVLMSAILEINGNIAGRNANFVTALLESHIALGHSSAIPDLIRRSCRPPTLEQIVAAASRKRTEL